MKFSIVSYMDEDATAQVRALQRTMSEITRSKASLSSWQPHVTVGDGITVNEGEIGQLVSRIEHLATGLPVFDLKLSGFGYVDDRTGGVDEITTPYVIYIDVVTSDQLLELIDQVEQLSGEHEKWYLMPQPYTPHVTLAFRDLDKAGYDAGMEYLKDKNIEITSKIDHIALVEKLPDSDLEYRRINLPTN